MRQERKPGSDAGRGTSDRASATPAKLSIGERRWLAVLRLLVEVRDDEVAALLRAFLFVFCVLAGNYVIRPIRDEMGITGGTRYLPGLFATTFGVMIVAWPVLSTRFSRTGSGQVLAPLCRILQLILIAFFIAFRVSPPRDATWVARLFFVWASIANLLLVSVAWGSLAGRFRSGQAVRLFGFISAGGTLGAIVGSALAGLLARTVGPVLLLPIAVLFFELGLFAARPLFSPGTPVSKVPPVDTPGPGGTWAASARARFDPYVAGLGLWTLLFTMSSAFVYMEQARIVDAAIRDPAARTALFAGIDLMVNLLGLTMQVLLTGRVLGLLGAGGSAAVLPLVTLAGVILLTMRPTVATVQWFQVVRRAVDYAIARPSREVFYTVLGRGALLRTKGMIDTAVYRAGDAAGASAYGLLAGIHGMAVLAPLAVVPLSLAWIAVSLALGRALRRRTLPADEWIGPAEARSCPVGGRT
ncbi:MAG: hypothetical protein U0790_13135 [Isosphaeraceae bacterium]